MRRVQDSRSGYKWGIDGLLTSDHTSTPPLVESVTWGDCKPQGRHAYCNFPLGMPKTIATRVESTYSNLRPFSFVNLKIKLCESASTTSCTANRAVKVPVCCLPIGQQQPPTSRAKHGECCCYRWLLKFEVKRLAAWCGGATAATSWSGPSSKSFWNAFTPSLQGWFVRLRQQIWWSGPQIDHRSWS